MKRVIYQLTASLLPLLSRCGRRSDAAGIIMFHGVHDHMPVCPAPPPRSSVSLEAFQSVILQARNNYRIVSMDELTDMATGAAPWRNRCLAVTFDDSLKCHLELIAPRLLEWGVPATFYISTEAIDKRWPYWWLRLEYAMSKARGRKITVDLPDGRRITADSASGDHARKTVSVALRRCCKPLECEKVVESVEVQLGVVRSRMQDEYSFAELMTWDDVRELAAMGLTIGSHTVSHPNLTLLDREGVCFEVQTSREIIERQTQMPCRHFCYPHGYYSDAVCEAAKAAGYVSAVTVDGPGWNRRGQDPHRLERLVAPGDADQLAYVLTGAADLVEAVKLFWRRKPNSNPLFQF